MVADLLDSLILSKRFKLRTEPEENVNIFLSKFSPLTCLNTNLRFITNWLQSSQVCEWRHMPRMIATPREYASLGKG